MIQKLDRSSILTPSKPVPVAATSVGCDSLAASWIFSIEELNELIPEWRRLATSALHPNVSMQPEFLIPAFKYLASDRIRIAVVRGKHDQKLLALVPIMATRLYRLPIKAAQLWKHDQCFDNSPLLHREHAEPAFGSLLELLKQDGFKLFAMDWVTAEGPLAEALDGALKSNTTNVWTRDQFERAALRPADSAEAYLTAHVSKNVRKKNRRYRKQLTQLGTLECQVVHNQDDVVTAIEDFLRLESSGWKGREGTALASDLSSQQFFKSMAIRMAEVGAIRFLKLTLDNEPIAMLCDLYAGDTGFAYKTAYDESYAEYSPGLLAELDNIERIHRRSVRLIDSCTEPGHPLMNRIWGQRLEFRNLIAALQPGSASWTTTILPLAKRTIRFIADQRRR